MHPSHPLRRASLLSLGGLAFASLVVGQGAPLRTLEVTGRGEVTVPPDLAIVELAVETTSPTAAGATADSSRRATAVLEAVRRRLGPEDVVRTTGVSLQPRYAQRRPGDGQSPEIAGYVATNQLTVEIRRLETVGAVIDAALEAGANRTQGLRFEREDRDPIREALAEAGRDARAQAEAIAESLGVRLVRIVNVSTSQAGGVPIYREQIQMRAMAEAVSTPVETGDIDLSATVSVVWEIQ